MKQILENWELKDKYSQDEVFRVEGILDVNTIEYFPCPKALVHITGKSCGISIANRGSYILISSLLYKDIHPNTFLESSSTSSNIQNQPCMSYGCRGFFPVTSFSSHSCTNNTFHKRKDVYVELENVYLNNDMETLKPHEIILETRAKLDIKEVFMLMYSNKYCYMIK